MTEMLLRCLPEIRERSIRMSLWLSLIHIYLDPEPIPVLPEWSPIAVFGGYGAPLHPKKAARAGVPFQQEHQHSCHCHEHGCMHSAFMLMEGMANASRPKYSDFWGSGCGCFAF